MKSRKHFIQIPAFVQKTKFKYPFEKKANANSVLKSHKINVNECIRLTKEINELEKKINKPNP